MANRADNSTKCSRCVFWSDSRRRCTASLQGLFIPAESYIVSYCTSQNFIACKWHQREMQLQKSMLAGFPVNRRKHSRRAVRYPVTLRSVNRSPDTTSSSMAATIDISNGGMQVASRKPLVASTLVRLIYNCSVGAESHEDLVLVRWCHFRQDTMNYRAGLSFNFQLTGNNRPLHCDLPQVRNDNTP